MIEIVLVVMIGWVIGATVLILLGLAIGYFSESETSIFGAVVLLPVGLLMLAWPFLLLSWLTGWPAPPETDE